jgi:hypothetical protein
MLLQQRQELPVNQLTGKLAQMKTTLDLPDELVREMKLRALMQGRTLRDLAADFLRQGVILRGRESLVASRCFFRERLGAFIVGGREKSKHHL